MKKLFVLTNERTALAVRGRALVDKMNAEDYVTDPADQVAYDALKVDIEAKEVELAAASKLEEAMAPFAAVEGVPYTVPAQAINREEEGRAGFTSLGDFARSVHRAMNPNIGIRDERLNQAAAHQEQGTGEAFMVPAAFANTIWDAVEEQNSFLDQTTSEITSQNQVSLPSDESTPWGANGIQALWRNELDQLTESNLLTETADVKLNELFAFATSSEELLEDVPLLNSRLERGASRAISWKLGEGIFRGDGAGKLEGFLNSPALVSQAKESAQSADTIVQANISKMYTRMFPSSINRAKWLGNIDILPQLQVMTIGNYPVYLPPSGLAAAPHGMLMGRPIEWTEHANTIGDVGDLVFADLTGYYTVRKATGVKFAQSMHLYFDYNKQAFRWVLRIGGQTLLSAPISPAYGGSTKSHFVALAERAE